MLCPISASGRDGGVSARPEGRGRGGRVPRIAEPRDAAEPVSAEQKARHARILEAAARLGSEKEFERVQMHEVAKLAGVAIATLYRYFPSKTHLFVGVMIYQVDQMERVAPERSVSPATSPQEAVYDTLLRATRALLRRPLLSSAMIQAMGQARATEIPDVAKVDRHFRDVLYGAAGMDPETVTGSDAVAIRVLLYTWFGIVQPCLNGRISAPDAEADMWVACRLLLGELSTAR